MLFEYQIVTPKLTTILLVHTVTVQNVVNEMLNLVMVYQCVATHQISIEVY